MISVFEATRLIQASLRTARAVACPLEEAAGRVLLRPVLADRAAPPFDRIMMDGYALRHSSLQAGRQCFELAGVIPAGTWPPSLPDERMAFHVMTGGVLPPGCDVVLPVEWCRSEQGSVHACIPDGEKVEVMQNVHPFASDGAAGRVVLDAGTRLGAPELAVAATEGAEQVWVNDVPRISLITTGDEVVPFRSTPAPWQIRGSHAIALRTLICSHETVEWRHTHVADHVQDLEQAISQVLFQSEMVLLAGGVSRGEWDHVPEVLASLGVACVFHGVSQRPGKPLWFGVHATSGCAVFGLPGNPVSALCAARRYVIPALAQRAGQHRGAPLRLPILETLNSLPTMTRFVPVSIHGHGLQPRPVPNSGALHALTGTDGFVECPPNESRFSAGKMLDFWPWRT